MVADVLFYLGERFRITTPCVVRQAAECPFCEVTPHGIGRKPEVGKDALYCPFPCHN